MSAVAMRSCVRVFADGCRFYEPKKKNSRMRSEKINYNFLFELQEVKISGDDAANDGSRVHPYIVLIPIQINLDKFAFSVAFIKRNFESACVRLPLLFRGTHYYEKENLKRSTNKLETRGRWQRRCAKGTKNNCVTAFISCFTQIMPNFACVIFHLLLACA